MKKVEKIENAEIVEQDEAVSKEKESDFSDEPRELSVSIGTEEKTIKDNENELELEVKNDSSVEEKKEIKEKVEVSSNAVKTTKKENKPDFEERKKRWGDRKDGWRVRDTDAMHVFMPYIMPNRADNEALVDTQVEIANALEYLSEKNNNNEDGFRYSLFHLVLGALAKVLYLRPKMNYFIQGHRLYEHKNISFSFMVKKDFTDQANEAFAIFSVKKKSKKPLIEQIHTQVRDIVRGFRTEQRKDGTMDKMGVITKLPRFLVKLVTAAIRFLDYHGWMPKSLTKDDPDYSSIFITNLGSIGIDATYHHLVNYGTNSVFIILGQKKFVPVFRTDGTYEMKHVVDFGMTIDERIADGVYFAKSLRLFKYIMNNPKILDEPLWTPVDYLL